MHFMLRSRFVTIRHTAVGRERHSVSSASWRPQRGLRSASGHCLRPGGAPFSHHSHAFANGRSLKVVHGCLRRACARMRTRVRVCVYIYIYMHAFTYSLRERKREACCRPPCTCAASTLLISETSLIQVGTESLRSAAVLGKALPELWSHSTQCRPGRGPAEPRPGARGDLDLGEILLLGPEPGTAGGPNVDALQHVLRPPRRSRA